MGRGCRPFHQVVPSGAPSRLPHPIGGPRAEVVAGDRSAGAVVRDCEPHWPRGAHEQPQRGAGVHGSARRPPRHRRHVGAVEGPARTWVSRHGWATDDSSGAGWLSSRCSFSRQRW
jgi:hypothetical protein